MKIAINEVALFLLRKKIQILNIKFCNFFLKFEKKAQSKFRAVKFIGNMYTYVLNFLHTKFPLSQDKSVGICRSLPYIFKLLYSLLALLFHL